MSLANTFLVLAVVFKAATPVLCVMLYAAALASAVYMFRQRG